MFTSTIGALLMLMVAVLVVVVVSGQDPTKNWKPNAENMGAYCWSHAPNPNDPSSQAGGCGCENTQFRIDDRLHIMESTGHHCGAVFSPWYNETKLGDCSYFRIRDMETGYVIANVSEALNHDFCSAVLSGRRLYVFCSAFGRRSSTPGPCQKGVETGCYIGSWYADIDDLTTWSKTAKAVQLPDGVYCYNNGVTLTPDGGSHDGVLPRHQAVMVLESSVNFAINVGTDGDLSKNWVLLNSTDYKITDSGPAGEGTGGAPSLKYHDGWYYSFGGGWITNGPARSRNLTANSWEVSPLAPIAIPAVRAAAAGLKPSLHLNTDLFQDIWKDGVPDEVTESIKTATEWNFGVTDPDSCCVDGNGTAVGPMFMLHTVSQQGGSPNVSHVNFAAMLTSNMTEAEWLASYFP